MVAKGHRLCDLHVREARQDGVGIFLGEVDQCQTQAFQQAEDVVDGGAHVQADIRRDLVIARAASVQALAGIAHQLGQTLFDIQVHIFQIQQPFELAAIDLGQDLRHPTLYGFVILLADDFLRGQHLCMRERALDIDMRESLIEKHGRGVAFHKIGHRLGEAGGPGFGLFGKLVVHGNPAGARRFEMAAQR